MKLAVVYCGLPGSGKSFFARQVKGATVIETDDYWYSANGHYSFDPALANVAHGWNLRRWIDLCRGEFPHIICSNTNTTLNQIAPYVEIALAYGYDVKIIHVDVSLETSMKRNTHNVPLDILQLMAEQLDNMSFPPWWNVTKINNDPVPYPPYEECESYETCPHGDLN